MENKSKGDNLVTVAQAAKALHISIMTIYRWSRAKPPKISSEVIAGFLFIPKEEVERLQNERAPAEASEAHN